MRVDQEIERDQNLPKNRPSRKATVSAKTVIGRIPILDVQPVVNCGRWPAKAVVGETFEVSATVFREGHEKLGAGVVLRVPGDCDADVHRATGANRGRE